MQLDIALKNGGYAQVADFQQFIFIIHEWKTFKAEELGSISLDDRATYLFKGTNSIMISGKEILYLEIN